MTSPATATRVQRDLDDIAVAGHRLHCVADWQRSGFCNVLCTTQVPADELDSLFTWVRDRWGRANDSTVHASVPIPGWPALPARRSLTWTGATWRAPELLVSGRPSSNTSMTLTVSYRGDFRG